MSLTRLTYLYGWNDKELVFFGVDQFVKEGRVEKVLVSWSIDYWTLGETWVGADMVEIGFSCKTRNDY